eukprot:4961606-Pleurochrysis_carterae.AAC.4
MSLALVHLGLFRSDHVMQAGDRIQKVALLARRVVRHDHRVDAVGAQADGVCREAPRAACLLGETHPGISSRRGGACVPRHSR